MSDLNNKYIGSVLSFGELLLRITPDANGDWLTTNQLPFYIGGAELNVATALALWDVPSKYLTALPDNGLSLQIVNNLQNKNIDISAIRYTEGRLGLYYLVQGKDLKHDALIYDRANSAFSGLKTGLINWDVVLEGVSWFHFSAICPAVSQNLADLCLEALQAASAKGITISVDLNYRSKLWQYGKSPGDVMPALVNYCNVVMGNVWAAEIMLGIEVVPNIHETGQKSIYVKEALHTSEKIVEQYPMVSAVANTFRFDGGREIDYYATLYTGGRYHNSHEYHSDHAVDKVGSGDCFMAGLIYGFHNSLPPAEIVEFAAAAAFQQLFIKSDATDKTAGEITNYMNNIINSDI